jgi:two-component system phosphate regulon response regulator PhoB
MKSEAKYFEIGPSFEHSVSDCCPGLVAPAFHPNPFATPKILWGLYGCHYFVTRNHEHAGATRWQRVTELMMSDKNPLILIVDDEAPIRDMLRMSLELKGYRCLEAEDAVQAHSHIVDSKPDLVLLDWMMPGTSGIELVRRLKRDAATAHLPVILLTARAEEDKKIYGLDAGADDYITKPFSPRELIARINALLRRSEFGQKDEALQFGELVLNPVSHRVTVEGRCLDMGPTEYRLLHFFMTHPERVYNRSQLLDQVWGGNVYVEERTVDVHIRRLRKALESVADAQFDHSAFVQTVRGAGYRFSASLA